MLPGLDTRTGALPLGRFGATLDQIKRDFVDADYFSASSTRKQIWQDFWSATAGLRSVVPVISVWVGGSFLTDKLDPDDIDLVYWCQDNLVNQVADPRDRELLQLFADNLVRRATGLRVDTRYCQWHLYPEADRSSCLEHQAYVTARGYWDDFWMRRRAGTKDAPPQLADALPKRGYFEVELDGFHGI
ncbi:hypothetical protein GCM10010401_08450 [Rarobacter faecitabidus]|uniref:Uncharacterized protein n=1 Tax=Rarobacter faecitabidus TaxID=13243 RepID=A0A542ZB26_RARFA|nr:hypothetical protein [Rarobacter faecitabidus]TQL57450.1 hypothetical protein FB461_2185 [Rarobacter faecitabidus]